MGKPTEANDAAGLAAQAQTDLAQQLVQETGPVRQNLISDSASFLSGNRDVTNLPEFEAFKGAAEDQFGRAKDNIIANTPEGGPLIAALTELEGKRAGGEAAFTGSLASDEVNRALQLASFGAAQGSQGLSSAGFIQSQRAGAEAQANAGKSQGAGQALGTSVGLALKDSDRRLKKNIINIGSYGPYNLYSFDYLDGTHSVGVMAQEMPDKYVTESDGYLMVDYGMLCHG